MAESNAERSSNGNAENEREKLQEERKSYKKILIPAVFFILILLLSAYSAFKVKKSIASYNAELANVSISIGEIDYDAMQKYIDRSIFDLPLVLRNGNEKSVLLYNATIEIYVDSIGVNNRTLGNIELAPDEEKSIVLKGVVLFADKLDIAAAIAARKGENPKIIVKLSAEKQIKIGEHEIKRIKVYGSKAEKELLLLKMFGGKTQAEFSRELIERLTGKEAEIKEH